MFSVRLVVPPEAETPSEALSWMYALEIVSVVAVADTPAPRLPEIMPPSMVRLDPDAITPEPTVPEMEGLSSSAVMFVSDSPDPELLLMLRSVMESEDEVLPSSARLAEKLSPGLEPFSMMSRNFVAASTRMVICFFASYRIPASCSP